MLFVGQSDEEEDAVSLSQYEQELLSRLSPDVVCQLIDSVFNELVNVFKVHTLTYSFYSYITGKRTGPEEGEWGTYYFVFSWKVG